MASMQQCGLLGCCNVINLLTVEFSREANHEDILTLCEGF
jgi:hypothetical protein